MNMSLLLSTIFVIKTLLLGRFMTDWSKDHTSTYTMSPSPPELRYFLVLKQTLWKMR
ncbi:hypothetical protein ALC53_08865 [Atta colombica]|uniref:Uncharacterized protein n=1 Tax=Atta colombica TaxID=520822 RepID=A0A195B863_9HYME|nr:hypothetical protein ALC53_08865 [Atta colombica]